MNTVSFVSAANPEKRRQRKKKGGVSDVLVRKVEERRYKGGAFILKNILGKRKKAGK